MPWLNVGSCVVSSQCYNFSARSFIHSFALNHFHVQNSRVFMFFANFHLILDKLNSTKWMMITFKKKKMRWYTFGEWELCFEYVRMFIFNFIKCSSTNQLTKNDSHRWQSIVQHRMHMSPSKHTQAKRIINTFCECPTFLVFSSWFFLSVSRISRLLISF